MKIRVSLTVEVNPASWANEFGVAPSEVRKDVQEYIAHNVVDGSANGLIEIAREQTK